MKLDNKNYIPWARFRLVHRQKYAKFELLLSRPPSHNRKKDTHLVERKIWEPPQDAKYFVNS